MNNTSFTSTDYLYKLIKEIWDMDLISLQEQVMVLFFNRAKKLIGFRTISTGSMSQCVIDTKLIVSLALHCMADGAILVHNHPSGRLQPSRLDELLTVKVEAASKLIDVELLDHIIISENSFFSFTQNY